MNIYEGNVRGLNIGPSLANSEEFLEVYLLYEIHSECYYYLHAGSFCMLFIITKSFFMGGKLRHYFSKLS